MTELSREARRLIDLARNGDDPGEGDEARVGGALARRIALGVGLTVAGVGATKSALGAAVGVGLTKLCVVSGVTLALGAGAFGVYELASRSAAPAGVASVSRSAPGFPVPSTEIRASRGRPPVEPELMVVEPAAIEPVPSADVDRRASRGDDVPRPAGVDDARPSSPDPVARFAEAPEDAIAPGPADSLQAETAALRRAQASLRAGDAEQALAQIAAQERRYPGGALGEERAAARVMALCQLGRAAAAREEAQHFEQRFPRSPLLGRVREACRER